MTPTQAQIEAARDAVWRECPEFTAKGKAERVAIAALTAAAQVGITNEQKAIMQKGIEDEMKAATIERCAQAVWDAGGDNVEFHAAAIRALKEGE